MEVVFTGTAAFEAALIASVEAAVAATNTAVARGAALIEGETKKALTTYSHPKGTPTPSPPGQPPAIIGGALRRSVITRILTTATLGSPVASASVGPTIVYARIQELGGRTGRGHRTTLPPRPYLAPTVNRLVTGGSLERVFADAWRAAVEAVRV